ncbi:hypothetical protein PS914_04958 [Pseudomonas fluorescens]|uniref:Uncharacterized protein n=1 Tax=Pseudomonas fluorescens TaxID=294 RepID=A0A5E7G6V7_PSEFL|nr:hypothetical protein PS833_06487 [Pseudomonas fluorescens]VVQ09250.1 hypothetical protein PS914_04958 [Pseudomonas fluorescens]
MPSQETGRRFHWLVELRDSSLASALVAKVVRRLVATLIASGRLHRHI